MSVTMTDMEQKNNKRKGDRHKPGKHVRVRAGFVAPLEQLASRNETSTPEEVNRAVRELLEREQLWPLPDRKK